MTHYIRPSDDDAAEQITGTPDEVAERLRALLDAGPPAVPPRETANAAAARAQDTAGREHEIALLRYWLATDFAAARGWTATTGPLAVRELARRSNGGSWHRPAREWLEALVNPTFYRDAGRRAAGAVGHPPADLVTAGREHIEAWAAERDLVATFPDFPSWTFPGRTTLVVFEPTPSVEVLTAARPAEPKLDTPLAPPTAPDLDTLGPLELLAPPEAEPEASEREDASDLVEGIDMPLPPEPSTMRPVAPLDIEGIVPRDLSPEPDPGLDIVDPAELLIDGRYQRDLTPKSLALVRRIVENWSWARFKVPTCVRVDGQLHVVDGQHTCLAAVTHGGIAAIPVLVVAAPEVTDRAAAFVSHATDRVQATITQVHQAAVLAGDEAALTIDQVCRAAGVELMPYPPPRSAYKPGQSVALTAIRRVVDKRGPEQAQQVLEVLAKADLAPISADHIRAAEALLCDPDLAGEADAERVTAGMRTLAARGYAEAKTLAATRNITLWRAMVAVILKNRKTRPKGGRPGEGEAA